MLRKGQVDEEGGRGAPEFVVRRGSTAVPTSIATVLFLGLAFVVFSNAQFKSAVSLAWQETLLTVGMAPAVGMGAQVAAEGGLNVRRGGGIKTGVKRKVITSIKGKDNETMQIYDDPIPEVCNPHNALDLDGDAVKWGLGNKAESAAACCKQCTDMNAELKKGDARRCHLWTWCGDPSGICWTMDIHSHTTGDCWLKYQKTWDGITDLKKTNLIINHQGKYSAEFKAEHKTAPEIVPWISGLIAPS